VRQIVFPSLNICKITVRIDFFFNENLKVRWQKFTWISVGSISSIFMYENKIQQ
jgi:hypothetical protein